MVLRCERNWDKGKERMDGGRIVGESFIEEVKVEEEFIWWGGKGIVVEGMVCVKVWI